MEVPCQQNQWIWPVVVFFDLSEAPGTLNLLSPHCGPSLPWFSLSCSGSSSSSFFFFLAVLGLRCCTRAFSSCGERGLLFVAVCMLLTAVASLVAEHGLWACRLQ